MVGDSYIWPMKRCNLCSSFVCDTQPSLLRAALHCILFFFVLWSALCLLMHSFCPTSSLKIWSLLLITLWVFVGALCYDYLLTLVMLQYHAHENRQRNSESGSSKCCAQTRNLESLSGIFLSSTLRVRPHCSQIKRSSVNGDKYL